MCSSVSSRLFTAFLEGFFSESASITLSVLVGDGLSESDVLAPVNIGYCVYGSGAGSDWVRVEYYVMVGKRASQPAIAFGMISFARLLVSLRMGPGIFLSLLL